MPALDGAMQHLIYVVDIGSPRTGLAWARLQSDVVAMPTGGTDLSLSGDAHRV